MIQVCEMINSGIQPLHNTTVLEVLTHKAHFTAEQKTDWSAHFIRKGLKAVEAFLVQTAGTYCFGHSLTAADMLLQLQVFTAGLNGINVVDEFPVIACVAKSYAVIEALKRAAPEVQPDTPKE